MGFMKKFVKTMIAFLLLLSTFSLTACDFIKITSYKHESGNEQSCSPSDSFTSTSQSEDGQSDTDTDVGGEIQDLYGQLYDVLKDRIYVYDYYNYKPV